MIAAETAVELPGTSEKQVDSAAKPPAEHAGLRLKRARLQKDLTVEQGGELIGVSKGEYHKIEDGKRELRPDHIYKAAKGYNVDPISLVVPKTELYDKIVALEEHKTVFSLSIDQLLTIFSGLREKNPDAQEAVLARFDKLAVEKISLTVGNLRPHGGRRPGSKNKPKEGDGMRQPAGAGQGAQQVADAGATPRLEFRHFEEGDGKAETVEAGVSAALSDDLKFSLDLSPQFSRPNIAVVTVLGTQLMPFFRPRSEVVIDRERSPEADEIGFDVTGRYGLVSFRVDDEGRFYGLTMARKRIDDIKPEIGRFRVVYGIFSKPS